MRLSSARIEMPCYRLFYLLDVHAASTDVTDVSNVLIDAKDHYVDVVTFKIISRTMEYR